MFSKRPGKPATVWSSAGLRLAAVFSLIFGLGGAGLIAAVDFGMMRFAESEVRDGLTHQIGIMRTDADRGGTAALIDELEAQPRNRDARRYLFLVQAPDGRSFSNGLTAAAAGEPGFHRNLPTKGRSTRWPDQRPDMMVLTARAADGGLLSIGRDTQHLNELRAGVRAFALWSGLALIALAILAGLVIGRLFMGRLEAVNAAAARVMAGRDSERLPAIGFGREFDQLAETLNRMLDRQEATLSALKTVSEGMAHDLRTPLARLRNRLEEVEAAGDPAARREALDQAVAEADQLNGLLESILALARLEGGVTRLKTAPVDAGELVRWAADIYGPLVEETGGRMTTQAADGAAGPLMVLGQAELLTQALSNLIDNAVTHGGPGVSVSVQAVRDGGQVVLSVADDGPGVPADERDQVLRRFHRLDRSRSQPGSGLGLTMAAAAARAHGGELRLSDNGPGLRVELRLPAST